VHEVPAPWHADAPCVCQRTLALAVAIAFAPWDILFSRIFIANVQITEMPLHRVLRTCVPRQRAYSTPASKPRSGHADFYASLLPAMIPVALLGSAVYMVGPLYRLSSPVSGNFSSCPDVVPVAPGHRSRDSFFYPSSLLVYLPLLTADSPCPFIHIGSPSCPKPPGTRKIP
jgi:hypothetical protein